jgi:hypothetical protein
VEHSREPLRTAAIFNFIPNTEAATHPRISSGNGSGPAEGVQPGRVSSQELQLGSQDGLNPASKRKKGTATPHDSTSVRKYGKKVSVNILENAIKNVVKRERGNHPTGKFGKTFATLKRGANSLKNLEKICCSLEYVGGFHGIRGLEGLEIYTRKELGLHLLVQGK